MGVPSSAHTSYFDLIVKTRWRSRKTSRSNARSTPSIGERGVFGGGPARRWRRHDGHSRRRPAYSGRSSYTSPQGQVTTTPTLARLTAWTGVRPARLAPSTSLLAEQARALAVVPPHRELCRDPRLATQGIAGNRPVVPAPEIPGDAAPGPAEDDEGVVLAVARPSPGSFSVGADRGNLD